ncbi:hypothetical protein [Nocardioides alcanivorans]|uniref:hypothetical protein n=1 Tax=Nocardioides alcanivorans TaxID=2897352 RepID=UPI001F3FA11E|nr:hypothetical protein [Nocardioides alcanivorans]
MSFCAECGSATSALNFCPQCGFPVASAAPVSPPPASEAITHRAPAPPLPPPPAAAAPSSTTPSVDLGWLLRGNWIGAALTAVTAVLIAFVVSGGLLWVADPPDTSTDDRLTITAISAAAAFGAGASGTYELDLDDESFEGGSFEGSLSGNVMPLTITLLALGAAIFVFRRLTASYPSIRYAVGDALRAALLFALVMFVLVLVFRGGESDLTEEMGIWDDPDHFSWGASAPATLFVSFFTMAVVLVLACFVRRDWLGPALQRLHDHLGAPLVGLGAFAALLPLAGLIGWCALWFTTDGDPGEGLDANQVVTGWIYTLGTAGIAFVHAGAGGRLGASYAMDESMADGAKTEDAFFERLSHAIDGSDGWGLWLAIPTMVVVLIACAVVVARRARTTARPQLALLWWPVLMFAFVPLLSRLASGRGSMHFEGGGEDIEASGFVGLKPSDTLLIPLITILVALIVGAATGMINLREVAQKVQQDPSRPAPPSTQP